jgi:PmbA protein
MSSNFQETTEKLKNIIDTLGNKKEYEFHFSSTDGADVTSRFGEVENIQYHNDESLTVTCIDAKRKGVASTNNLSDESIKQTIEKSKTIASFLETDEHQGLAKDNLINQLNIDCNINFPKEFSTDQLIGMTVECEKAALNYDKRINNSEGSEYGYSQSNNLILNSHGAAGSYSSTSYTLSCVVIAEENGLKERDYAYTTRRNFEKTENAETIGKLSAKKVISRLGAKSISTRKCPVILTPELSVGLFSSFLSAINGNNIYKKSSFLSEYLNKQVFAKHINITEKPDIKEGLGTRPFDSEGVQTFKKNIIEEGVLNTFLLDTYSASQLKSKSTGNSGYSNILVESSKKMLSNLIESIDEGILVTEMMGSGANMLTGDYSRGAFGYLIEKGKISYPVTNFTIASNMIDMFKNIEEIGNDYYMNSKIKCGSVMIKDMTIGGS